MTQELQWSRSLTVILLTVLPRQLRQLPLHLKAQFLFAELWYPAFALSMLAAFLMPLVALVTKAPLVDVSYVDFLLHAAPVTLVVIGIAVWVSANGWTRPQGAPVVSWEAAAFQLHQVAMGSNRLRNGHRRGDSPQAVSFRITPKTARRADVVSLRVLMPYILIVALSLGVVIGVDQPGCARGYYDFALVNSAIYTALICFLVLRGLDFRRAERHSSQAAQTGLGPSDRLAG